MNVRMKKSIVFTLFIVLITGARGQIHPTRAYPGLFDTVQRSGIFSDSKTFPDCKALYPTDSIRKHFSMQRNHPSFNLKEFVGAHFDTSTKVPSFNPKSYQSIEEHIRNLWPIITRKDLTGGKNHTTRIRLPRPYVVPGGRFNEMYYWDSYFTLLGLEVSGNDTLIEDMVYNYAYLIDKYGFIPNGTRSYFMTRSQPPFWFLMINLYLRNKYHHDILNETPQEAPSSTNFINELSALLQNLEKEHTFWMRGKHSLTKQKRTKNHLIRLGPNNILNRYYDQGTTPRPESYTEDIHLSGSSEQKPAVLYKNTRAACESGWDFSSRWMVDGRNLETINTLSIIPVDLNALLFGMEAMIAKSYRILRKPQAATRWKQKAAQRKKLVNEYLWNEQEGYYYDYNYEKQAHTANTTLAGVFPLFLEMASQQQAEKVARKLNRSFLKDGGMVTTLTNTNQQWDYPNGWPPLQWITFVGLTNYGYDDLAMEAARRWLNLNKQVFRKTGKMMEKYNVVDTTLMSGGGEYPTQDGFGWTNGVYLKMLEELNSKTR